MKDGLDARNTCNITRLDEPVLKIIQLALSIHFPKAIYNWFYFINMMLKLRFVNIVSSNKHYLKKYYPIKHFM
jgi:hypothetical protein